MGKTGNHWMLLTESHPAKNAIRLKQNVRTSKPKSSGGYVCEPKVQKKKDKKTNNLTSALNYARAQKEIPKKAKRRLSMCYGYVWL